MSQVIEKMQTFARAGLSVIPVGLDKKPLIPTWAQYQKQPAMAAEISAWGSPPGVAIVGGAVSGNVICIDIDIKHDSKKTIDKEFFALLKEWGHEGALKKCAVEKTPSVGYHVVFRAPFSRPCEKLARDFGKTEAMIEIKSEGGYFVCAPTLGWELKNGSFENLPTFDADTANAFISAAWALDRTDAPPADPVKHEKHDGKSPFDDYSERATAEDLLSELSSHGWRRVGQRGENILLVRPGKDGRDYGATFHISKRVFYVFTSSSDFHQGRGYGPVAVFTVLNHGGDFKAAARDLVAKGYGEKRNGHALPALQTGVTLSPVDGLVSEVLELYHKPYYPGESTGWRELDKIFQVEKGQLNICFGKPGDGKSSFVDALMFNLAKKSGWRVMLFSPENKSRAYHASKLCEIAIGKPWYGQGRMTPEEAMAAAKWISEKFIFLSQKDGGSGLLEILEAVKEAKPDAVVVDPWNRLNHPRPAAMTETEYIGEMLARTSALCKSLNLSFWFVVHPQKLRRDKEGRIIRPGFYEVSGSAHWANMADNGLLIWRDMENQITEIETVKVRYRHNGSMGVVKMKFDRPSGRFACLDEGIGFLHGLDRKAAAAGDKEMDIL